MVEESKTPKNFSTHVLRITETSEYQSLENQLWKFRNLESLGINTEKETSVYENFEKEIKLVDGRYEVCLPWKSERPMLPDNYGISQKRLRSLKNKLKEYKSIIEEGNN